MYLGFLMLYKLFSSELYSDRVYRRSDDRFVLGHYSSARKFSGKYGLGGPIFLEFWSPTPTFSLDQNFRDKPLL